MEYRDRYAFTADNVRLHWRDWPGGAAGRPAILCLPGLTRNARDFEALARRLAPRFRVLTPSFRGRGESGYARDPLTYVPMTYLADMRLLLADAGVDDIVVIGTSLGGIVALLMEVAERQRIAGLVLNDVGPAMEEAGLARVREGVGRGGPWASWLMAARDIARRQAAIYPDWALEEWLAHAKRLCRLTPEGRIAWDYDPEIATPFRLPHNETALDLWRALDACEGVPILSIRGALSDILSAEGQAALAARVGGVETVTVPGVGHAPTLDEPAAAQAVLRFVERFA